MLGNCPDFRDQPSMLQIEVEKRGHILVMSPKSHPEVAGVGIEYSWGMSKKDYRKVNTLCCLQRPAPPRRHQQMLRAVRRAG